MGATAAIGVGVAQGYMSGEAGKASAKYNSRMADLNARLTDSQAARVIKVGERESMDYRKQVKKTIGSQRAALAAQGIDVDSGSALDIQDETAQVGAEDAMRIKNNAYLEAWGLKSQASNMRLQGEMGVAAANNAATNSLLTGGLQGYMMSGGFKGGTPSGTKPAKVGMGGSKSANFQAK